jgi:hypothetical protein
MSASKNQTVATKKTVSSFLKTVDKTKAEDSKRLVEIYSDSTGEEAVMWGPAIIGFGSFHYVYESGREGDSPVVAFSPRKNALVLYFYGFDKKETLLKSLGKFKGTGGCIYVKKLTDINEAVLKKMIAAAVKRCKKKSHS